MADRVSSSDLYQLEKRAIASQKLIDEIEEKQLKQQMAAQKLKKET